MAIDVGKVFNRKPILNPMDQTENSENLNVGFIQKEPWGVVHKSSEKEEM